MAQKLIKIGIPLNKSVGGFPCSSIRVADIGGIGWGSDSVAAHVIIGQRETPDSPITPLKICRLDKDAVFG